MAEKKTNFDDWFREWIAARPGIGASMRLAMDGDKPAAISEFVRYVATAAWEAAKNAHEKDSGMPWP